MELSYPLIFLRLDSSFRHYWLHPPVCFYLLFSLYFPPSHLRSPLFYCETGNLDTYTHTSSLRFCLMAAVLTPRQFPPEPKAKWRIGVDWLPESQRGSRSNGPSAKSRLGAQRESAADMLRVRIIWALSSLVHEVASYLGAAFSYDEMDIKMLDPDIYLGSGCSFVSDRYLELVAAEVSCSRRKTFRCIFDFKVWNCD